MKRAARNIILIIATNIGMAATAHQAIFDRLYPETLFGQAREHCIKAWGALDELLYAQQRDARSGILLDAALGQLLFAKSCVKKIDSHKARLSSDELLDFSRVIGTVIDRSQKLNESDNGAKISLLKKLLTRLRENCQKIMGQLN